MDTIISFKQPIDVGWGVDRTDRSTQIRNGGKMCTFDLFDKVSLEFHLDGRV